MSVVKVPPGQTDGVGVLVARYQEVIERARASNVSPDAVFAVRRMEAAAWNEDRLAAAIALVRQRADPQLTEQKE